MLTYAQSINKALDELLESNEQIILLGEDIRDPYGGAFKITKGLSTKYSKRVINTPISEAAITGVATGLALNGFKPILEIMFGDFITLCSDQIINHLSKFHWMYNEKVNVPIVIRTPMGGYRGYGPTHSQSLEKLLLGVPGIDVVAASIFHNPGKLLIECIKSGNPILFIENKTSYPRRLVEQENTNGYNVQVKGSGYDQTVIISHGMKDVDVTLVCYGGMVCLVEEAVRELLMEEEISVEVFIPSCIKPLNISMIIESVRKSGRLVLVEEGSLEYGWGSEIAAKVQISAFEYLESPIMRIAAKDLPIANAKSLENEILPQKEDIKQTVRSLFE